MLKVNSISKSYVGKRVVDNVSFTAEKGKILGVLGPNGAGKTTIIRCIMGITIPDEGRIEIGDNPEKYVPREIIGYLPEERGLYKDVKVLDIIMYFAKLKNYSIIEAKNNAIYYLEKFGIGEHLKSKVETLSKGMAQKVQFIISIVHKPKLLVLDEPFSGLDPVSQNQFLEAIKKLAEEGTTILLSSHQMNLVEELCDDIFLINHGKKVVYGNLLDVKERFANFKCIIKGDFESDDFQNIPFVTNNTVDKNRAVLFLEKDVNPVDFLAKLPKTIKMNELVLDRISLHDIFVNIATGGSL